MTHLFAVDYVVCPSANSIEVITLAYIVLIFAL
jgi:hypothetical protein